MEKYLLGLIITILVFICVGCGEENTNQESSSSFETTSSNVKGDGICIVYFSATQQTKKVAEGLASYINSDIYEIIPVEPYSSSDLNYSDDSCRANQEQRNPNARPKIKNHIPIEQYDTVFLGYPIWWETLPKIIYTFCDTYQLENEHIIPFCTSGGSGIFRSVDELKKLEPQANISEGKRFSSASEAEIKSFIDSLNQEEVISMKIKMNVNGYELSATLEENESAKAFYKLVKQGLTLQLSEYGGFEKVGPIGQTLPSNDTRITAQAGDLILYNSNQFSLMYGSNPWSYTKLGVIDNLDQMNLESILGSGDIIITFSIEGGTK